MTVRSGVLENKYTFSVLWEKERKKAPYIAQQLTFMEPVGNDSERAWPPQTSNCPTSISKTEERSHGWDFLLFPRTVDTFTGEVECRGPNPSPIRFNVLEVPRSSTAHYLYTTDRRKEPVIALAFVYFEAP
jgi:hypothetical protein